jgi:hypothetical protein
MNDGSDTRWKEAHGDMNDMNAQRFWKNVTDRTNQIFEEVF